MKDFKIDNKEKLKKENTIKEQYLPKKNILSALGDVNGKTLVDIGIETGYYTEDFSKAVGQSGKVFSVDLNLKVNEMISYKTKSLKNVTNTVSNENRIPIETSTIDVCISVDSFHRFDDKDMVVKEIQRFLKPRGRFIVVDFNPKVPPPPGPQTRNRVLSQDLILVVEDVGFRFLRKYEVGMYHYCVLFESKKT